MKLAPTVALTLWGGAYMMRCANAALPKGGLDIELPTQKGPVRLVARRLSYDIARRSVVAHDAALFSPHGELIARAGWVNLKAPLKQDPTYHIRAGEIEARLERTKDGKWKHFDLLPERKETEQETPLDLTIESARIEVLDRTAEHPSVVALKVTDARANGSGKRWLADGACEIAGYGSLKGLIRIAPEVGVGFNVTAHSLDAGRLANQFRGNMETRKIEDLKRYQAESAIVTGSIRGHFNPKGAMAFDAQTTVNASQLNLDGNKVGTLEFSGNANESYANGLAATSIDGARATYQGLLYWKGGVQTSGALSVDTTGSGKIPKWAAEYLPRELKLSKSRFSGWLSYGKQSGIGIDGTVWADEAEWSDENLKMVEAKLHIDPQQVLLSNLKGQWMGGPLDGTIYVNTAKSELKGALNAKYVKLGPVSKRIHGPNLTGYANFKALLSGKLSRPVIDVRSAATASTQFYGSSKLFLGNIEFAAQYTGGKLNIERFAAAGQNGVFVATGLIDVDTTQMNLKVDGNGVKLAALSPDLNGTGLFRLNIKGTPERPEATGRAEIIGANVMGANIPFAGGTVRWDANGVMIRDVMAVKGATNAKGYVSWNSRDLQLDGEISISDVILSDWLGDDVSGSLGIRRASLRGTINNPIITVRGSGKNIVVSGVRVDDLTFSVHALRNLLVVNNLKLSAGGGDASIAGYVDLAGSTGVLSGSAKKLPLARLLPRLPKEMTLTGTIDGDYEASLEGVQLASLKTEGQVNDVTVNGALIGSGKWSVAGHADVWSAVVSVGQLERYIELSVPIYDHNEDILRGSLTALNLDLATLRDAFKRYLPKDNERLSETLDSASGDLGVYATISMDGPNSQLDVENATIERLSANGQDLGRIALAGSFEQIEVQEPASTETKLKRYWKLNSLEWTKDDQKAMMAGEAEEQGEIRLDGEISNLKSSLVRSLVPDLPHVSGTVDLLSFFVSGQTQSPVIQASLKASNLGLANDTVKSEDRVTTDVSIENLTVKQGQIVAQGRLFHKGIQGILSATLPFKYPFELPQDEPFYVQVGLQTNDIKEFQKYAEWMDPKSVGRIGGGFEINGNFSSPIVSGFVQLNLPVLAVKGVDTYFKDFVGRVDLQDDQVIMGGSAKADSGGTLTARAQLHTPDFFKAISDKDSLMASLASGYVKLDNLLLHHNAGKGGSISLVADGNIDLKGTLKDPKLTSSGVVLKDVNGVAPTEFAQQATPDRPDINPQFDIRFDVRPGAKAKASNAEVYAYGSGILSGSLYRPDIQSNFTLTKGSLKLPNARIQLREGGAMRFAYSIDREGLGQARLDVDLQGSTNVAAIRYGDTVDRYSIELQMRGDILKSGDLHILAHSDPPDLSQDRILNILGQGDFFQGLAQGNQSAIASFALPTFLDPVTSMLAKNFGLEYLMVEYDLQKRTTLTAARTLGGGFTFMGRRQISPSTFGRELYEMKLNYRLPFNDATLRSFMLSLGTDQDRPWKFSIEFGRRF